jgi:hypothetical protein
MNVYAKQAMVSVVAGLVWLTGATADPASLVKVESGGVTADQFSELNQRADDYSLKLIWAAKGSGAYLADVDVSIHTLPSRDLVLQHRTEGPVMLVDLPPGRYVISGRYTDVTPGAKTEVERTIVVPRQGTRQMMMYFDTADQVSPESPVEMQTARAR